LHGLWSDRVLGRNRGAAAEVGVCAVSSALLVETPSPSDEKVPARAWLWAGTEMQFSKKFQIGVAKCFCVEAEAPPHRHSGMLVSDTAAFGVKLSTLASVGGRFDVIQHGGNSRKVHLLHKLDA